MPVSPALALLVTFGVWLTMLGDLDDSQVMGVIQALVLLIVLEVIVFTGSGGPGPPSSQVHFNAYHVNKAYAYYKQIMLDFISV